MASPASAAAPRIPRSFAGLLEEYTAPPAKFPPKRDWDGLEDDVATLTYEHALKAHARYHRQPEPPALEEHPQRPSQSLPLIPSPEPPTLPHTSAPTARKSSSVTVRLTAEEDEQLRARAVEAGLTVSAYLRSCAFEVDSLRAQVKQAVAHMRLANPDQEDPHQANPHPDDPQPPTPRRSWLSRLLPRSRHRAPSLPRSATSLSLK